ncbi:MAG: hypothetical protein WCI92_08025 [Bacteroidota bacterium]
MKQFAEKFLPELPVCRVGDGQNSCNADALPDGCMTGCQPVVARTLQPVPYLQKPQGYKQKLPDASELGRPPNMPQPSHLDRLECLFYSLSARGKPGNVSMIVICKLQRVHSCQRINLVGSRVICPKRVPHRAVTVGLCPERGWKLPTGGSERTARDGIITLAGSFEIRNTFWPVSYHATSEFAAKISFSKPKLNHVNTMFAEVTGEYALIKTTGFF